MSSRRVLLVATGMSLASLLCIATTLAEGVEVNDPLWGNASPAAIAPPPPTPSPLALPAPDSPRAAIERLRIAYEGCLLAPFARLLAADFRFVSEDPALRERFPAGLSRDEEIASAHGLFRMVRNAPGPFRVGERRIEVHMDTLLVLNDPTHPDDPARRRLVIAPRVRLRIRLCSGEWIETTLTRHEFHVVRGDAASLPAVAAADADHWYVCQWIERPGLPDTVAPPPILAQAAAKDSARDTGANDSLRAATPIPLAILPHANPALGPVVLDLSLRAGAAARLDVLDVAGRIFARRDVREFTAGRHRVDLAGEHLPPGVYWLRLTQRQQQVVSRLVVLR